MDLKEVAQSFVQELCKVVENLVTFRKVSETAANVVLFLCMMMWNQIPKKRHNSERFYPAS